MSKIFKRINLSGSSDESDASVNKEIGKKNSLGGKDSKQTRSSDSSKNMQDAISSAGLIHGRNDFLSICDYLIEHPRVFRQVIMGCKESFHIVDMALMFHVRRLLYPAILCLLQLEADENLKKGVQYETFRTETAPMLFVSAVLSLDTMQAYKQNFVSECTVFVMAKLKWSAKQMGKVVKEALEMLLESTNQMPEELIQVLKAFHATASNTEFQASVFFLRYLCPGLAQPEVAGGMDKVPENLKKSLLNLAKALQLVANKVDPAEGTFAYPILKDLKAQYATTAKIFETINKGGDGVVSPPVTKSLVEPAVATYKLILTAEKDEREAERWKRFYDRLAPLEAARQGPGL